MREKPTSTTLHVGRLAGSQPMWLTDPALLVAPATPVTALFGVPAFARVGRAVVVDERGEVLGIVSITDLQRRMRADEIASPAPRLAA